MQVDIKGLSKAAVLAALHNGTRALGMGIIHDLGRDMTEVEAEAVIAREADDLGFKQDRLYFDYVSGRPLKVNIAGDEFDAALYDRDAGEGAAERAIAALRVSA